MTNIKQIVIDKGTKDIIMHNILNGLKEVVDGLSVLRYINDANHEMGVTDEPTHAKFNDTFLTAFNHLSEIKEALE